MHVSACVCMVPHDQAAGSCVVAADFVVHYELENCSYLFSFLKHVKQRFRICY